MHQWTGSSLVQVMACHLLSTKPSQEPILSSHPLDLQSFMNIKSQWDLNEIENFQLRNWSWKFYMQTADHFVQAAILSTLLRAWCSIMTYNRLSARLQYLQCISNGDTAVLHRAFDIYTCIFFIYIVAGFFWNSWMLPITPFNGELWGVVSILD